MKISVPVIEFVKDITDKEANKTVTFFPIS